MSTSRSNCLGRLANELSLPRNYAVSHSAQSTSGSTLSADSPTSLAAPAPIRNCSCGLLTCFLVASSVPPLRQLCPSEVRNQESAIRSQSDRNPKSKIQNRQLWKYCTGTVVSWPTPISVRANG